MNSRELTYFKYSPLKERINAQTLALGRRECLPGQHYPVTRGSDWESGDDYSCVAGVNKQLFNSEGRNMHLTWVAQSVKQPTLGLG